HFLDYVTFLLLTGTGLGVGCYFSFCKKSSRGGTTDEIFLGGKSLRMIPLAASFLATAASATGIIGVPAHMYAYGLHLGWMCLLNILLIPFAISVVVPVLYQLNMTSVFQGGLRGVVWADCLQALLTLAAPVVITAKVFLDSANGDTRIRPLGEILNKKYLFNVSFDLTTDETVWGVLIASAPIFFNRICLDQGTAQRYFASRTEKEAKRTVIVGTVMMCVFSALLTGTGAALICRYRGCDPVLSGSIKRFDQVLPLYLLEDISAFPGLAGLFLAGVVSAGISTVSSLVNSQAAVAYFDVLTPFFKVDGSHVDIIVKTLVGGVMTACSLVVPYMGSLVAMFMAVNAAITGPFVGLVVLGLTAPFANTKGAGAATVLVVAYQLVHLSLRINCGAKEQRMPVSLEFCAANLRITPDSLNITSSTYSTRMETMKSNKGGTKLCLGGYMYTRQMDTASGTRWRCTKRNGCKALAMHPSWSCSSLCTTYVRTILPGGRKLKIS
ncbi:hypothetical protein MTO96_031750, partial [Rhipicephalus appendiculatus]